MDRLKPLMLAILGISLHDIHLTLSTVSVFLACAYTIHRFIKDNKPPKEPKT